MSVTGIDSTLSPLQCSATSMTGNSLLNYAQEIKGSEPHPPLQTKAKRIRRPLLKSPALGVTNIQQL